MSLSNHQSGEERTKVEFLPGRQRQVFDILGIFQTSQLIGIVGENGSGKSSLVQRGLLCELHRGFLGIGGRNWNAITIRPGTTPIENLAAGINQLAVMNGKQKLEEEVILSREMRSNNEGLRQASSRHFSANDGINSLLIIDNFEDIFQFRSVADNQTDWDRMVKSFISNICKCTTNTAIPIYILIILRSDFVTHVFEHRQLQEILSNAQYSLPQFRKAEFMEVIDTMLKPHQLSIDQQARDAIYLDLGSDLKNLTLLRLLFDKLILNMKKDSLQQITRETLQTISIANLYATTIESFYDLKSETEKKLIEKVFKQITVVQEDSKQRRPIQTEQLLRVTGSDLTTLRPLLYQLQEEFKFLLEIINPFQERIGVQDHNGISKASVINIKNEQFIPHWPRLTAWIKEEKESQELYKRLSDTAVRFDQELTGYLKPPDLDYALIWYEKYKPDEPWANQFNKNHQKTIDYLLESKTRFRNELTKKELEQKEKIKRIRKTGLYIILSSLVIFIVIAVFAIDAKKQEGIAHNAREKAEREKEKASLEKERADLLYNEAQQAMKTAQTNEQLALIEKNRADEEYLRANYLRTEAEGQRLQIQKAFLALDQKSDELSMTVFELQVSDSLKGLATKEAEAARAYQEARNKVLSLRNQLQKKEYQKEELADLSKEIQAAYLSYQSSSIAFKGTKLPNNDLYQILLDLRKYLINDKTLSGIANDITSLPNGLRKIIVSSSGILATGGDDGILIYSKDAINKSTLELKQFSIGKDRIRTLAFINAKDIAIGTVNGKLYRFDTNKAVLSPIITKNSNNQIIEQLISTNKGLFVLVAGEVQRHNLTNEAETVSVNQVFANRVFKINDQKLLVVSNDNSLLVLDTETLQWQTIMSDLKNKSISALVASGERLFIGLEDGDIYVCKSLQLGSNYSIKTELVISAHQTRITSLAFDPSSQKLFTASLDQKANIIDLSLGRLGRDYVTNHLLRIEGFNKWIWDFALVQNQGENAILTVDENGALKIWPTGTEILYEEIFLNREKSNKPGE